MIVCTISVLCWFGLLKSIVEGVMSGIITGAAFNDTFPATKDNSTMQGFVTAIYEIGQSQFQSGK